MKKKEFVYRELLEKKNQRITQLDLSKKLGISLSTVNNSLKPLIRIGAVETKLRSLEIKDKEKIIIHWANTRNLEKDIIYSTRVDLPIKKIENSIPENILFTAYSGFKFKYNDVPADYSEVYVYADEKTKKEIEKRFPPNKKTPNLFVICEDYHLRKLSGNNIVPAQQIFVDLWNLKEWYAKDFISELKKRLRV